MKPDRLMNEDIEVVKLALRLYGLEKEREQHYLKEAFELQLIVDDMKYPSSAGFEEKNKSSNNAKLTPAVNMKQHEKKLADDIAAECHQRYEVLDKIYRISERLQKMPQQHRMIIQMVFFKQKSYEQIADNKVSKQSVGDRVRNALRAFTEV